MQAKINLINLKKNCQELKNSKSENVKIKIEPSWNLGYKCINCMDIKESFECKKFEENELREIVNMFCCECKTSEE